MFDEILFVDIFEFKLLFKFDLSTKQLRRPLLTETLLPVEIEPSKATFSELFESNEFEKASVLELIELVLLAMVAICETFEFDSIVKAWTFEALDGSSNSLAKSFERSCCCFFFDALGVLVANFERAFIIAEFNVPFCDVHFLR